jgi:perosamine synthetase
MARIAAHSAARPSSGFYPNKQIMTGEGGMIVTDDRDLAECCRSMADQGRGDGGWLSHVRLGCDYRLDEMSAALGVSQMARLDALIAARARVAAWYHEALAGLDDIIVPTVYDDAFMSWFVYVIRLSDAFTCEDRDRLLHALREAGIGCRNYFQPLHLQPFIREALGTRPGQFPITEAVCDRTVALPFFPQMTRDDVQRVVSALERALSS